MSSLASDWTTLQTRKFIIGEAEVSLLKTRVRLESGVAGLQNGQKWPALSALFLQELLHFHRCHAACACRGDRLSIPAILDVPTGEDAWDFSKHVILGD